MPHLPGLSEAKRLPKGRQRIPTWPVQFRAQSPPSVGPRRLIPAGRLETTFPGTPTPQAEPYTPVLPTGPVLSWAPAALARPPLPLSLERSSRAAVTAQALSVDMFSTSRGLQRPLDPAGMSKAVEVRPADQWLPHGTPAQLQGPNRKPRQRSR